MLKTKEGIKLLNLILMIRIIVITLVIVVLFESCGGYSSLMGGIGGGIFSAIGKVSNTFGTPLGRDIDSDGDNDSAFVIDNIAGGNMGDVGNSIYVDSNGKIYVTGYSLNGSNEDMYVIRLNNNGSMDMTFNGSGKVVLNSIAGGNGSDIGNSIYVDSSGKIYVTGDSYNGSSNYDMYVIRLNSNGSLDSSFGVGGKVVVNNIAGGNGYDYGNSIYVDSSGKVYVTGRSWNGSNDDMYVIRLNSNGSLDNSFGSSGKVVLNSIAGGNWDDIGNSIYVDSSGKIYVTGGSPNSGGNLDMYVLRLDNNGSMDMTFNGSGKVVLNSIAGGNANDDGNSIYVDSSGKVYVTGRSWNGSNDDMYVIRLNSNGSLDNSFGSSGKVVLNNIAGGNWDDFGNSIYVDSNGKIYVTGYSWNGSNWDMYVIRLNSNGSMDSSFGIGGKVLVNNIAGGNMEDYGNSIYVDSNGNIYVTGGSYNGSNRDMYVIKIE